MACHWAATLGEAIQRTEGRDIDLGQVMSTVVPHGLHLDYDLDFQNRRVDDVAPTFTSPLLSGLIGNLQQFERPEVPGEPASFKADENLWAMVGYLPTWTYPVHLMRRGLPPRDQLAKGMLKELSLLAKERAIRISLLRSLNRAT